MAVQSGDVGTPYERTGEAGALEAAIADLPIAMVLTNPALDDNPIVYVNEAFERITYYSREFAVGRNCRFLQGEGTDPDEVRKLSLALKGEREVSIDLDNYRADGSRFRNRLVIAPIRGRTVRRRPSWACRPSCCARKRGPGASAHGDGAVAGRHHVRRAAAPGQEPPRHGGLHDPHAGRARDHAGIVRRPRSSASRA